MTKRKKKIYKKKGKVVKDLTRNIFKILNEDSSKFYNYKQIAAKLNVSDTEGKNQIIKNWKLFQGCCLFLKKYEYEKSLKTKNPSIEIKKLSKK